MKSREYYREKRWYFWAEAVSKALGWPTCTGMPWEYVVCDRRSKTGKGRLEMVHIDARSAENIRKQIATILKNRTSPQVEGED